MNSVKKSVSSVFVILCAVLALAACTPDPDPIVPTAAIQIKNIPASVARQKKIEPAPNPEPVSPALFKVYVQLSEGMDASAGYVAKGEHKVTESDRQGDSYTVTITGADLVDPNGQPWTGTNWANLCVVISPETVNDIFDIDANVGVAGSSTESTVVLNWGSFPLMDKSSMKLAGNGTESYKALYGKTSGEGDSAVKTGIIVADPEILGAKENPLDTLSWDEFK